jgi:hypothetical protein
VAKTPAPAPLIATAPPAHSESSPSSWHTWAGVSLAVAGSAALGWGIVWIAINDNVISMNADGQTQYHTKTAGWILASAGAAAVAGGAVIFFTGNHKNTPDVALGLTPSSVLLQGRF